MSRDVPTTDEPCDVCKRTDLLVFDFMGDYVCTACLNESDAKEAMLCSLCSHEYREHTGPREPHNTQCTHPDCICGSFFLDKESAS